MFSQDLTEVMQASLLHPIQQGNSSLVTVHYYFPAHLLIHQVYNVVASVQSMGNYIFLVLF